MSNIRTVSDTKRAFYTSHTRPISSIYRRVVEELMVEMHLLSVNAEFQYDSIYALGVVTTFDRFMKGYRPDEDLPSIFNALCQSMDGADASRYRQDSEALLQSVGHLSKEDLRQILDQAGESGQGAGGVDFRSQLGAIAHASSFKYSRLFAIGLLTVLESIDPAMVADDAQLSESVQRFSELLKLSKEKVDKDLEIYRGNLEKLQQAQEVLEDVLKADRKKREDRANAAAASSAGDVAVETDNSSETSESESAEV